MGVNPTPNAAVQLFRRTLSGLRIDRYADRPAFAPALLPGRGKTGTSPANERQRRLFAHVPAQTVLVRRYHEVAGPTDGRRRRERRPALVAAAAAARAARREG